MDFGNFLGSLASIGGKIFDSQNARSQANKERDRQHMYATSGIQMRVKDAQKAGIHPLYALGASTYSPSTVVGGTDYGSMGQDISRAVQAVTPADSRLEDAILRNWNLRNQILEGQVAGARQSSVPYSTGSMMPVIAGQGNAVMSAGSGWDEYPVTQTVNPPETNVQANKHLGYTLIPNLKRFSPSNNFEKVYGDEGLGNFIHNSLNYIDSFYRAFTRYHSPRFEARRRQWHGGN